jgi:hypothetical protein
MEIKEKGGIEEPKFGDFRKIGNNRIVLKAFELIGYSQAYYIGIIPTSQENIKNFTDKNDCGLHFLAWETVRKFCEDQKLNKVLEIFEFNKGQIY